MSDNQQLRALILACSLSGAPAISSSEKLARELTDELQRYDVQSEVIRVVDHDIQPGVELDMGDGDEWPEIRKKMIASQILVIATPIWVGHPSSVAQRVVERLDAELGETDEQGRLQTYGRVGGVVVVGNEDGAHKVSADLFQALNDVGFTIPANAVTYWNGEAMHKTDYKDLGRIPEKVAAATKTMAVNLAHAARLLAQHPYPAPQDS